MGRGLGDLQRTILAALEPDHVFSVAELAIRIHGLTFTDSEYETVRRAIKSLDKRKLIADTWWRMFFIGAPKRYGLPAVIDAKEEIFCDYMDRREKKLLGGGESQQLHGGLSAGSATLPTVSGKQSGAAP